MSPASIRAGASQQLLERMERRPIAVPPDGRNPRPAIECAERKRRVRHRRIRIPGRNADLGMIEGRPFETHAIVVQRFEKRDQIGALRGVQREWNDLHRQVRCTGKIAAARREIHYLLERCLSSVLKIRAGELDVAESRDLEGAGDPPSSLSNVGVPQN